MAFYQDHGLESAAEKLLARLSRCKDVGFFGPGEKMEAITRKCSVAEKAIIDLLQEFFDGREGP